jgi:hypothetical protein
MGHRGMVGRGLARQDGRVGASPDLRRSTYEMALPMQALLRRKSPSIADVRLVASYPGAAVFVGISFFELSRASQPNEQERQACDQGEGPKFQQNPEPFHDVSVEACLFQVKAGVGLVGRGLPRPGQRVGASPDLRRSKKTTYAAERTIKNPIKQVFDVANRDWSTPIFFGPFAFLPSKVKINANQKDDRSNGDTCAQERGLNSRQRFGAFATHLSHLVAEEISFNRTKMAIGKESPSC